MSLFRERVYMGCAEWKFVNLRELAQKQEVVSSFIAARAPRELFWKLVAKRAQRTACGLLMFVPLLSSELISSQTFWKQRADFVLFQAAPLIEL